MDIKRLVLQLTGFDDIDDEHLQIALSLKKLIEKIENSTVTKADQDVLKTTLATHFTNEESKMKRHRVPALLLAQHKADHQELLINFDRYIDSGVSSLEASAIYIELFFNDLIDHIELFDKVTFK